MTQLNNKNIKASSLVALITLGLFLFSIGIIPAAGANPVDSIKTFDVYGTQSIFKDNLSGARQQAINNALETAIMRTIVETLDTEILSAHLTSIHSAFSGKHENFIQNFNVLSEATTEKNYLVLVRANILTNAIKSRLTKIGIIMADTDLPKILFMMADQETGQEMKNAWWADAYGQSVSKSESAVSTTLKRNGFDIIPHGNTARKTALVLLKGSPAPDNQTLIQLGRRLKADIILFGRGTTEAAGNTMGEHVRVFKTTMEIKAVNALTGEIISELTETGSAVNSDVDAGKYGAMVKAGTVAGNKLAKILTNAWKTSTQQSAFIEMTVGGVNYFSNFVKFRRQLKNITGIKAVTTKEMMTDETTLRIDYENDVQTLGNELLQLSFDTFDMNIYQMTPNTIRIELISR